MLNFDDQYRDPHQGFDRRKVKGVVASLIRVKEMKKYSKAVEVAAGGKVSDKWIQNFKNTCIFSFKSFLMTTIRRNFFFMCFFSVISSRC